MFRVAKNYEQRMGELEQTLGSCGTGSLTFIVAENKDVEWQRNHAVAETEEGLQALLLGAAAINSEPLSFLWPVGRQSFFVGA